MTLTATWKGRELPVWRFDTFDEFEKFLEDFYPAADPELGEVGFEMFDYLSPEASGILFSSSGTSNPLAAIVIREHLEEGVNPGCSAGGTE